MWLPAGAQDARGALDAAAAAMGASSTLHAVEYIAATGNAYALGQAAGPGQAVASIHGHAVLAARQLRRAGHARTDVTRIDDEKPPAGGGAGGYNPETQQGGIRPIPFGPMTTTAVRDGRTEDGALQIWLTPHGFLKGAAANAATLTAAPRDRNGSLALSFKAFDKYTVTGTLNRDNLVERVQTTVAHPLYGDTILEASYSGYQGCRRREVPVAHRQRQGGFPLLDVTLTMRSRAAPPPRR